MVCTVARARTVGDHMKLYPDLAMLVSRCDECSEDAVTMIMTEVFGFFVPVVMSC